MIKAVIFDLDGTLYDYDTAHEAGHSALARYMKARFGMERDAFQSLFQEAMDEVSSILDTSCAALHDRYLRFQILLERAGLPLFPYAWDMTQVYWDTFLDNMTTSPGLENALSVLKETGLTLGIGTNMMVDYQLAKMNRLGFGNLFDFMVSSEEAGSEKPLQPLFWRCAMKARCLAPECLFVGDSYQHDILGAQSAGMQALWYQPDERKASVHPEVPRIRTFAELPDYVFTIE